MRVPERLTETAPRDSLDRWTDMEADFLVVGAGAAGCVVASRLATLGVGTVLVVEAGGGDHDPRLRVPLAFARAMQRHRLTYRYQTDAVLAGGPSETWVRGRVLGGSTAINGMMYARGERADYDDLVAAGNPGWSWNEVLPAFLAMEDHEFGDGRQRGVGGPVPITIAEPLGEVANAVRRAADALGIPNVRDVNGGGGERIGGVPSTIRNGRRVSAADAFLKGERGGALRIITRSTAVRLLFDGLRVVGVRVKRRGRLIDLRARREVLLATGTIETPLLLERSGIGRSDVLSNAGIDVRVEHPNVGERVIEQRAVTVKARLRSGLGKNSQLNSRTKRAEAICRYLLCRDGVLARGPFDLLALVRAADDADRPDAQLLVACLSTNDTGLAVANHPGLMIQGYPLRPTTYSSVHIAGSRSDAAVTIVPRFLRTAEDRATTAGILRRSRQFLATEPLCSLVREEVAPGPTVMSADDTVRYALATGAGIYHAVGSCGMGPRDEDVVDPRLRVRGVDGLRVVDASVLPSMLSGGTAAPTMVVAWRAADFIKDEGR